MQFFTKIFAILFFFVFGFGSRLRANEKTEKKNYPDVHIHMDPSTFDLKDLQAKSEDRRAQTHMIRDLEEKINLDKQAFQQVASIQNDEIQQLSESVKMNSYYTMRKIMNSKENLAEKEQKNKKDTQMSLEKRMELLSNPFEPVKDQNLQETLEKIPKNRLETYGDIVDRIYGA